jgi:hypothetical protein
MNFQDQLNSLNPVKSNASIQTWADFYLKKNFSREAASGLLAWMSSRWDSVLENVFEYEISDQGDVEIEKVFQKNWQDMRHAFRIIMSLGQDDSQKILCFEDTLLKWPFKHFPDLSDDISDVCRQEFPVFNISLMKLFSKRYHGDPDSVILLNALVVAMDRLSKENPEHPDSPKLFRTLIDALKDPALYHSENILVLALILCQHPWLDLEGAQAVKRVFESRYVPSYVSLSELHFSNVQLRNEVLEQPKEKRWVANLPFSLSRYERAISWLGFQGRIEWHQFHMLGCLLNPFDDRGVFQYLEEEIEAAIEMEMPLYPISPGQQFSMEKLLVEFAENCLSHSYSAEWFGQESDEGLSQAFQLNLQLHFVRTSLASFLMSFGDWEEKISSQSPERQVIGKFLAQCSTFLDEITELQSQSHHSDVVERLRSFWGYEIKSFTEACLAERQSQNFARYLPKRMTFSEFWQSLDR